MGTRTNVVMMAILFCTVCICSYFKSMQAKNLEHESTSRIIINPSFDFGHSAIKFDTGIEHRYKEPFIIDDASAKNKSTKDTGNIIVYDTTVKTAAMGNKVIITTILPFNNIDLTDKVNQLESDINRKTGIKTTKVFQKTRHWSLIDIPKNLTHNQLIVWFYPNGEYKFNSDPTLYKAQLQKEDTKLLSEQADDIGATWKELYGDERPW